MEGIPNNLSWSKTKIQESFMMQNSSIFTPAYLEDEDGYKQRPQHNQNVVQNFRQYMHSLDEKLQKANTNQLNQLKNKYRFYLAKVDKLEEIKNSLQHRFDSMHQLVQNSSVIEHERQSILWFTAMINETSNKLQNTQCNVNKGKEEKKIYYKKIQSLKQIIKREKDCFFSLKRAEMKIKNQRQVYEKASKLQSANSTFKNIVVNKLNKKNEKSQRLLQISSRISNYDLLNLKKSNSSQQNQVLQLDKLPILTNSHENIVNNQFPSHYKSQSFDLQDKSSKVGQLVDKKEGVYQDLKQNIESNKEKKKGKKNMKWGFQTIGEVIGSKTNKQKIVKKISLLKQELFKQVQKVQRGQEGEKTRLKRTKYFYHGGQKNMKECGQKQKQCRACVANAYRNKLAIIKYSLHQQQVSKILSVPTYSIKNANKSSSYVLKSIKKEEDMVNLVTSQEQLQRKKQYQRQKQQFLTWGVKDIIKVVVEKDKIYQVLGLLQKHTFQETKAFDVDQS